MPTILPMKAIRMSEQQRAALNAAPVTAESPNKIRIALGIIGATQNDLARVAKMDPASISQIVNGRYERIALDTCQRIARALGIDCVDELFPMQKRKAA